MDVSQVKWRRILLYAIPLMIGIVRVIHFLRTWYLLPDEATYTRAIPLFFKDQNIVFYGSRKFFQTVLLAIAYLFNLSSPLVYIPVFTILNSLLASMTMFLSTRIAEKMGFKESWYVGVLYVLNPVFLILSPIILTEMSSIFLMTATIYVYEFYRDAKKYIVLGFLSGLILHIREPAIVVVVVVIGFLLKRRKRLEAGMVGLMFCITAASEVTGLIRKYSSLFLEEAVKIPAKDIVSRIFEGLENTTIKITPTTSFSSLVANPAKASIPMFLFTATSAMAIMLIFGLGFIVVFIQLRNIKKKKNRWLLPGVLYTAISSIHVGQYVVYATHFVARISTIIRLGSFTVYTIPYAIQGLYKKTRRQIINYAVVSCLVSLVVFAPIMNLAQSNLSSQGMNRFSLDYESPWKIITEYLESINMDQNVTVICEPYNRIRFFTLPQISYIVIPKDNDTLNEILQSGKVYLYGEKYLAHYELIERNRAFYLELLRDEQRINVLFENNEFYLYEVVKNDQTLVSITVDDGYKSWIENIDPVLKKYNISITAFINDIEKTRDRLKTTNITITWDMIEQLSNTGRWEFGWHSIDHYDLTCLSDIEQAEQITGYHELFEEHGLPEPKTFCYPYGKYDEVTKGIVSKYFLASRTTVEGINTVSGVKENPMRILVQRFNHERNNDYYKAIVTENVGKEVYIVFYFHSLEFHSLYYPDKLEISPEAFDEFIGWLVEQDVKIVTFSEGIEEMKSRE